MRTVPVITAFLCLISSTNSTAREDYWQQFVHYKLDVTLLPISHSVVGDEIIEYTNNSPDTLHQIFMHLYPNAYKDQHTIYAREARHFYRKTISSPEDGGYLEIESFTILCTDVENNARPDTFKINFKVHDTILEASLPRPLPPGGQITIKISFLNKVRKHQRRDGYRGFQYDMAQWYPKMCVYDEFGWNARPFHFIGEFYGEFGVYDVTIHTPFEYIIGATGEVSAGEPGWKLVQVDTAITASAWPEKHKEIKSALRGKADDGAMRTVTFHAENVHDFAWTACPDFLYEHDDWEGIQIHVLYRSRVKHRWSKIVARRTGRALQWLSEKFGKYPYPQVTVTHGLLGGGMEYPMLVMNSSTRESLILHEVGHIYFYGILGNNEWKEAWLDEGFTSFQTRWYMETRYGRWGYNRDFLLRNANWLQKHRPVKSWRESKRDVVINYINSGHNEPISQNAEDFQEPLNYSRNVYDKGAFFLDMLKYLVGDSTFAIICQEYFQRWKFKHVNEDRFQQVCEEVSGRSLEWFFQQWLHDTHKIDYAIGKVQKQKSGNGWTTNVTVFRRAEGIMPVEVQLTTASGRQLRRRWNGIEQLGKVVFNSKSKPENVVLDPDDRIMDYRRYDNNGMRLEVIFDYPNMHYAPRDAYLVTWRPSVWFNKIDKLRPGGRLHGKNGIYYNAELGFWYGAKSHNLDLRFRYSNPVTPLGSRTRGFILAQKMEGRQEIDTHLQFIKSRYLSRAPAHRVWVGFNHTKLLEEKYTSRQLDRKQDIIIQTWDKGTVNKAYVRYHVNPRGLNWFSSITLGFDTAHKDWGSDFNFNSIFSEIKFWWPQLQDGIFARFYAKKFSNGQAVPKQELIYLDGANPRARFKHFFLRSDGALPDELHYHLPGGGNVRGYYNNPMAGDQIWALNIEARRRLVSSQSRRGPRSTFGAISIGAFIDMATMSRPGAGSEFFIDAGPGIRLQKVLADDWFTIFTAGRNLELRFDFPLWVNKPLPGENAVRFRWVFGFDYEL